MEQPNQPQTSRSITLKTVLNVMQHGSLDLQGLMPWSSNYTFLGVMTSDDLSIPVIYKPQKGETPLWGFPQRTLYKREVAAQGLSCGFGWSPVPPTGV